MGKEKRDTRPVIVTNNVTRGIVRGGVRESVAERVRIKGIEQ